MPAQTILWLEHAYYPTRPRRYGQEAGRGASDDPERIRHLDDAQLMALLRYYQNTPKESVRMARAIDTKNRALRGLLGRIGRQLSLPFPLTMHVARHSFAVKALNSARVDVHLISRLLGHSSVLVTEKVYARFLLPTLSHEVRERLSFPELEITHYEGKDREM